ncbi:MAG TPA: amidohydrolase family protein [Chloroflexota bacterium]
MPIIDADTHVIETERTWDYLEGADRAFRPAPVEVADEAGVVQRYWLIDGRLRNRQTNIGKYTSQGAREMTDIDARLRHMDELGVDVQVLYPSISTQPITTKPEVELALCRAYNRWLGDIWSLGKGRLRWAMLPPVMSLDRAAEELRWCKDHGACAVVLRGVEGDRNLSDAYFFPLYQAASDLDMPIGIHAGVGNFAMSDVYGRNRATSLAKFKLPVIGAFCTLIAAGIPSRFPELRIGFIEVSSQWLPYAAHYLAESFDGSTFRGHQVRTDLLQASRFYIACQTDDDLPYVLRYAGEDNLLIGSDYGHSDTSTELEALRNLTKDERINPAIIDKILDANPTKFYGL